MTAGRSPWVGSKYRVIAVAFISFLLVATSASAQNVFPASGNVGIGTTNPGDLVDILTTGAGTGLRLIGTVSVAFGCPFEGKVDPSSVMDDVQRFHALGVEHVALGDTIGTATPATVRALFQRFKNGVPIAHFHDTRGTGLVNYVAAYDAGVRYFDSSFGGVGGHPAKVKYGGGHTGNVSTEDLVNLFESMGIATGLDLDGLVATAEFCEQALGRELYGRVTRSGLNPLLKAP